MRSALTARFRSTPAGDVAAQVSSTSGLELRGPFAPADASDPPRYFLRNVTAGMLDGDDYSVSIHVEAGVRVAIQPTAASRVFVAHGDGRGARLRTHIEVEPGAVLDFDAGLTIPHAGAVGEQLTEVTLHPGATLALSEVLAFGRLAKGERFAFRTFTSEFRVRTPEGRTLLHRRSVIDPERDRETLEMAVGGAGCLASVTLLGRGAAPEPPVATGAYAGISALPPHEGEPLGYTGLALAARVEQAVAALTSARIQWIQTTDGVER